MKPVIAFIYDFDGTLSPRNMQEYDFLPQLGIEPQEFWETANKRAVENNADTILAYMMLMLEKCAGTSCVKLTKDKLAGYGRSIEFFAGVESWFDRVNEYVQSKNMLAEHYVLSSGIKEMIAGSRIAKYFKEIFACSFIYNDQGVAISPGVAINYTGKTQFLFRINKGVYNVWDNSLINDYVPKDKRPVPFTNMIYFGDGITDVPCMKLIKDQGGHSISVYKPGRGEQEARRLYDENRVNFIAEADYQQDSKLHIIVKTIIDKVMTDNRLNELIPK
ncbi:MAG: HAD family hydrolase [Candidatus Stygibacter australis]|nr:HAD family hydrolase [Candidatus Stygibacter australis]MDP8321053.1 HAD family hydrolase [Candidatus Stygibacter australis]